MKDQFCRASVIGPMHLQSLFPVWEGNAEDTLLTTELTSDNQLRFVSLSDTGELDALPWMPIADIWGDRPILHCVLALHLAGTYPGRVRRFNFHPLLSASTHIHPTRDVTHQLG